MKNVCSKHYQQIADYIFPLLMLSFNGKNFTCRRYNFKTSQISCELNSEMSTKCNPFSKA